MENEGMRETATGQVESLAFGGQGILRHNGLVVFVPFAAPEDRVKIEITHHRRSFAEGELLEVLTPGPSRCQPLCPYFGRCGGCQLQHLTYEEQLRQKRQFVRDALQRIGKVQSELEIPMTPSPSPWAYRRHIRLTLNPTEKGYEAGYVRYDLQGVLPVSQCPIFLTQGHSLLESVQQLVHQLHLAEGGPAHLSLIKTDPGNFLLLFQFPQNLPLNIEAVLKSWVVLHRAIISGVMVQGKVASFQLGEIRGTFDVDGLRIRFSPLAFVQCHPEQSRNVYQEVLKLAHQCKAQSVLDLYCGIGVTSLLLAREGFVVTGIENNSEAVQMAVSNARDNGLMDVQFLRADVARVLDGLLRRLAPELVIVNPPRTGLDPVARQRLLAQAPPYLLYISCMPATLARDLAAFQGRGFELMSCRAYDMFPQTTHVETVVLLKRGVSQ